MQSAADQCSLPAEVDGEAVDRLVLSLVTELGEPSPGKDGA